MFPGYIDLKRGRAATPPDPTFTFALWSRRAKNQLPGCAVSSANGGHLSGRPAALTKRPGIAGDEGEGEGEGESGKERERKRKSGAAIFRWIA